MYVLYILVNLALAVIKGGGEGRALSRSSPMYIKSAVVAIRALD